MTPFDYTEDYVMEDEVVRISPLTAKHVNVLLECANDPRVWHYMLEDGQGRENLTAYIDAALASRSNQHGYPFVLYNRMTHQYVGSTRLYEFNPITNTLKMGHTWLGVDSWGKGINKRIKYMLFDFAFEKMGVERIGFGVSGENVRSLNALERIGCQREGVIRNFLPAIERKGRIDLILLGLLKDEWYGKVKEDLSQQIHT